MEAENKNLYRIGNIKDDLTYEERESLNEMVSKLSFEEFKLSPIAVDPLEDTCVTINLSRVVGMVVDDLAKDICINFRCPWSLEELNKKILAKFDWKFGCRIMDMSKQLLEALKTQLESFKYFILSNKSDGVVDYGDDYRFDKKDQRYKWYELIINCAHYEIKWSKHSFKDEFFLQSLCYFIVSKYIECYDNFKNINYIGVINIRKGIGYVIDESSVTKELFTFALQKLNKNWSDLKNFL